MIGTNQFTIFSALFQNFTLHIPLPCLFYQPLLGRAASNGPVVGARGVEQGDGERRSINPNTGDRNKQCEYNIG